MTKSKSQTEPTNGKQLLNSSFSLGFISTENGGLNLVLEVLTGRIIYIFNFSCPCKSLHRLSNVRL